MTQRPEPVGTALDAFRPILTQPIGEYQRLADRQITHIKAMVAQGMSMATINRKLGRKADYVHAGVKPDAPDLSCFIDYSATEQTPSTGGRPREPDLLRPQARAIVAQVSRIWDISAENRHGWGMRDLRLATVAMVALAMAIGTSPAAIGRWLELDSKGVERAMIRHHAAMALEGGYADWFGKASLALELTAKG